MVMQNKQAGEKVQIAFYIEPSVLKEIEELVKNRRYKSRSEFINKAIQELIEQIKRNGPPMHATNISIVSVLYSELLKKQNDGAIVFSADIVRRIMQERGLKYNSRTPSRLINSLKRFMRRRGWTYVGSFVIDGAKHHVFVWDVNNVPPRVLEIINKRNQGNEVHVPRHHYRNLAREIVDYVMKNPREFLANPAGVYKLTMRRMIGIAEALGVHNTTPSPWLVEGVMEELRRRGFEVWKEKHNEHVKVFFRKAQIQQNGQNNEAKVKE